MFMADGQVAPRAPITEVFPGTNMCGLEVDPAILRNPVKLHRLMLMLAAAFEGVEVTGNIEQAAGPGHLLLRRNEFIAPMETLTIHSVNRRLAILAKDPVHLLVRGPRPMQWLLILRFRAQKQHVAVLEKIATIVRAVPDKDEAYDGYMLRLFVPEGAPSGDEKEAPRESGKNQPVGADGDIWPVIDPAELRREIVEALNFDLD